MNKITLKILFIPADSIELNFSRSYFIAKSFSAIDEVYYLRWDDYKNYYWSNKKLTHWKRINVILSNLFTKESISETDSKTFHIVKTSLIFDAFINKLIGKSNAKKLMYWYNQRTLTAIANKIKPDVIIHADGFYFTNILKYDCITISDFQDDFPTELTILKKEHLISNLETCKITCVLSEQHANSLKSKLSLAENSKFYYLPNGVNSDDFDLLDEKEINELRNKFGENKKIISFIGAEYWIDEQFTIKLLDEILNFDQDIIVLFVGNIKQFYVHTRVHFKGSIPFNEANKYFMASDVGILLKEANDDFSYNSIPLKILQYGICGKPVVSPKIKWFEELHAPNVIMPEQFSIEAFKNAIITAINFNADVKNVTKLFWKNYTWVANVNGLRKEIIKISDN